MTLPDLIPPLPIIQGALSKVDHLYVEKGEDRVFPLDDYELEDVASDSLTPEITAEVADGVYASITLDSMINVLLARSTADITEWWRGSGPVFAFDCTTAQHETLWISTKSLGTSSGVVIVQATQEQEAEDTPAEAPELTIPNQLYELRRISGLSWDQIGRLLGVSRRTIHNWTVGTPIMLGNRERLGELLAFIKDVDRGTVEENRNLLLGKSAQGNTVFKMLAKQEYQLALEVAGRGPGRSRERRANTERPHGEEVMSLRQIFERETHDETSEQDAVEVAKPKFRPFKIR